MEVASQGTQSGSDEEPPHLDHDDYDQFAQTAKPSIRRCSTNVGMSETAKFLSLDDEPPGELRSLRSWPVILCNRRDQSDSLANARDRDDTVSPPAAAQKISEVKSPREMGQDPPPDSTLLYIDRIPADASSRMIIRAVEAGIGPLVDGSLDVIRKHKTRHCHGFALLSQRWEAPALPLTLDIGDGESIRVAVSDLMPRQRPPPETPTPRATLRLRLYAQRKSWLEQASRLTWAGVLAIIKDICKNDEWKNVKMLADDMKKKKPGTWAHPSVLLGAYFVDCGSPEAAEKIKDLIHDERACLDGVYFLVGAQYTVDDKYLHEKGKQSAAERKFASAYEKILSGDATSEDYVIKKKGKDRTPPESENGDVQDGVPQVPSGSGSPSMPPGSPGLQQSGQHSPNAPGNMSPTYAMQQQQMQQQQQLLMQAAAQQQQQQQQLFYAQLQLQQQQQQQQQHLPLLKQLLQERLEEVLVRHPVFRDFYYNDLNEQARSRFNIAWTTGPDQKMVELLQRLLIGGFFNIQGQNQPSGSPLQQRGITGLSGATSSPFTAATGTNFSDYPEWMRGN